MIQKFKSLVQMVGLGVLFAGFAIPAAFAQIPETAPTLPPGMKGSNPDDPRAKLAPGLYDAGVASFGIRHLELLKKPAAFQLGTDDANSERVKKTLGSIGISTPDMIPEAIRLVFAQLAFANSDIAFQGKHLFMGNFYGVNIYDISDPSKTKIVTSIVCPGGQGDVTVYRNLLFMSVEMPNGRLDCSEDGFAPNPPDKAQQIPVAQKDRFRGVRIFDISDIANPKQVGAVQSCRGSHTHTLVVDPKDKKNVYIYISGTSFVRQGEELAGCSDGTPDKNPETALFRIDVVKVPVDSPKDAKIVSSPRVFSDPATGKINALNDGGSHDSEKQRVEDTDQCHDITVYPEIGLAAGACAGNGILLDIRDPANPKRIESVNDKNYAYWHSASFSNDGTKVVYTDEWGGGMGARCRVNDPNVWGANALFTLANGKLTFKNYYKLPAAQGDSENCVAHNGSLVPVPGRDLKIQAWYQGGISLMDFTNPSNPKEIAYFDRGAIDPKLLILAGSWSAYWYNGRIFSSEIARGLDVFELEPTEFLTQNEIDAARSVQVAQLNVQTQERIVWSRKLVVGKAYLDQLERSKALSQDRVEELRKAIADAESTKKGGKLKKFSKELLKSATSATDPADANRLRSLADVLAKPQF